MVEVGRVLEAKAPSGTRLLRYCQQFNQKMSDISDFHSEDEQRLFRPFTRESLAAIEQRIAQENEKFKELEKKRADGEVCIFFFYYYYFNFFFFYNNNLQKKILFGSDSSGINDAGIKGGAIEKCGPSPHITSFPVLLLCKSFSNFLLMNEVGMAPSSGFTKIVSVFIPSYPGAISIFNFLYFNLLFASLPVWGFFFPPVRIIYIVFRNYVAEYFFGLLT